MVQTCCLWVFSRTDGLDGVYPRNEVTEIALLIKHVQLFFFRFSPARAALVMGIVFSM